MIGGWIKVHRGLSLHDLWLSETFTRAQAWVDLLLLANYQGGHIRRRGIKLTVKRGQVGYSQESLAHRWKWSKGKVIRFLAELKADERICFETELKNLAVTTLITIRNYEQYQGYGTEDGTVNGPETELKTVLEQEGKEEKEKPIVSDFFEKLWKAYPRKDGRKEAERYFNATVKNEMDMDHINVALGAYLNYIEMERLPLKYIKTGKVWFSNWQDWIPQEETDAS